MENFAFTSDPARLARAVDCHAQAPKGADALARNVAADRLNPWPVLASAADAWEGILLGGRHAGSERDWACVGRACAIYDGPSQGLPDWLRSAGLTHFTSPDYEAAVSALCRLFAPPRNVPLSSLTAGDRRLWLDAHFDGDTLLSALLALRDTTPVLEWWALFGAYWVMFDIETAREEEVRRLLRSAERSELNAMMTQQERLHLTALPGELTVYRGCYEGEQRGLSWSLSRDVAVKFPFLARYRRPGDTPLLLTAKVSGAGAVLLLGRGELEIIATDPFSVTAEAITEQGPDNWPANWLPS